MLTISHVLHCNFFGLLSHVILDSTTYLIELPSVLYSRHSHSETVLCISYLKFTKVQTEYNWTFSLLPSPPINSKYTCFTTNNTIDFKPLTLVTKIQSVSIMTGQWKCKWMGASILFGLWFFFPPPFFYDTVSECLISVYILLYYQAGSQTTCIRYFQFMTM